MYINLKTKKDEPPRTTSNHLRAIATPVYRTRGGDKPLPLATPAKAARNQFAGFPGTLQAAMRAAGQRNDWTREDDWPLQVWLVQEALWCGMPAEDLVNAYSSPATYSGCP